MASSTDLTVVFEATEEGWIQARIAEIPEVITVAPTRDEARAMVIDALREYLLSLGSDRRVTAAADSEALSIAFR
jgi:predicted RNase H-like HicB family nuclease